MPCIPVDELLHRVVVRHFYDCGQMTETVYVHTLVIHGVDIGEVAVGIRLEISL